MDCTAVGAIVGARSKVRYIWLRWRPACCERLDCGGNDGARGWRAQAIDDERIVGQNSVFGPDAAVSHANAVEKLQWYAMCWKIEVFHKILKSGCRAEQARLRTAERLVRLLAVFCILSWRVFWLTMLNRAKPDLEPALVLTKLDTNILDRLIPDPTADPSPARTLSFYLIKVARLGGYLALTKDPPPGNIVMWRGLSRLNDIALGATLKINDVGI